MKSSQALSDDPRVRVWLEIREPLERQLAPLGHAAIGAIKPSPGDRVLDIGCGIGGTPLALSDAVGPSGQVVAIDVLQAAINVSERDPNRRENITFFCADVQSHPFLIDSFDVAFSRFGVMFFEDPLAAFGNIRRALRPWGRLGFVCWRDFEDNELDALPLRAASSCLPAELCADAVSGAWLSFAKPETIRSILKSSGFEKVTVRRHDEQVQCGDLQATVDVCSRVGALGKILRDHPEFRSQAVPALERALRLRDGPNGPAMRAATWVVTAQAAAEDSQP